MHFPISCEICGQLIRNRKAFVGHLRLQQDSRHRQFKQDWEHREENYKATLRCRKCGSLWDIYDKAERDKKRCPSCEALRQKLGKRRYEALKIEMKPDTRIESKETGSKAHWEGPVQIQWVPGDTLCQEVLRAWKSGEHVNKTERRLGIPYKVYRAVLETSVGKDIYENEMRKRIFERTVKMAGKAHEKWLSLTPEEKAARFANYKKGSALERHFATEIKAQGVSGVALNVWQAIPIKGVKVPREADIKIDLGDGRKIVILCDGEIFHGPGFIYGDPDVRIQEDIDTARAYFDLGYTVLRYSESEILDGRALAHLNSVMLLLKSHKRVLRLWHPILEEVI